MFQLAKAGEAIQTFFQRTAERLARVSGFVQRESKITGAHWIQTLTFGFIETPDATLNQLAQVSTDLGVPVCAAHPSQARSASGIVGRARRQTGAGRVAARRRGARNP